MTRGFKPPTPTQTHSGLTTTMRQGLLVTIFIFYIISQSRADGDECSCSCVKNEIPATKEEQEELVEQEVEKIKEELFVDTTSLSSSVRKKSSAEDERPSAKNVGYLGIVMLGLAGGLILAMDVNYIIQIGHSIYVKLARS